MSASSFVVLYCSDSASTFIFGFSIFFLAANQKIR
jgi:hypothetical protein